MPNIMITKRCNLACPYCFANEFVNKRVNDTDISLERFKEILDFILGNGTVHNIGLIGGEPTCHKEFRSILQILAEDERIQHVTVYTNGILIDQYMDLLKNEKFYLLINCNEPEHMGLQYKKLVNNLQNLKDKEISKRTTLGVNYYKIDFNYTYVMDLIKVFRPKRLRVSISVPNSLEYNYSPLEYFSDIKEEILTFFEKLKEKQVIPFFDCNIFPACLISVKEMRRFESWGVDNPFSVLKNCQTVCVPVIDIMEDLTAVRCFGLSEQTKVSIKDFASIKDLRNYYMKTIDSYAINTYHDKKCTNCYKQKTVKCSGGCLIYKIDKILKVRKLVEEYNDV